jgi:hypothetical protein
MGRWDRWCERVEVAVLISLVVGGRMACRRVSILLIGPGVIGLRNIEGGAGEVSVIEKIDAIATGPFAGFEIDLRSFDDVQTGCWRIVKFESGILCFCLDSEEF